MNYSELKAAIASYLNRDDLTSDIPTFIELAHADIEGNMRVVDMIARDTITLDGEYVTLPSDWLAMHHITLDQPRRRLELANDSEIDEKTSEAGTPCLYSILGSEIRLWPEPSAEDATIVYYQSIPALSDSNTSNWLLAKAPDIYLFGALMMTAPFLVEDERLQTWSTLYTSGLARLDTASKRSTWASGMRQR